MDGRQRMDVGRPSWDSVAAVCVYKRLDASCQRCVCDSLSMLVCSIAICAKAFRSNIFFRPTFENKTITQYRFQAAHSVCSSSSSSRSSSNSSSREKINHRIDYCVCSSSSNSSIRDINNDIIDYQSSSTELQVVVVVVVAVKLVVKVIEVVVIIVLGTNTITELNILYVVI